MMTELDAIQVKNEVTFQALLTEKVEKDPAGIVTAVKPWEPSDKIPGFEKLNFGLAEAYSIRWSEIGMLQEMKKSAFQATLISTPVCNHIVRGFSRLEWAGIQEELAAESQKRAAGHIEGKSNEMWAQKDIQMRAEEFVAIRACVLPKYDKSSIREVPAGIATQIADAAMEASGLNEQTHLPPIKL